MVSFTYAMRSLLRIRFSVSRGGGLLSARCDQRLDWKTSRGQDYFVLSSCLPWNLIAEAVRRLQHEEDSARDAAASAEWASLKQDLTHEVRCLAYKYKTSILSGPLMGSRLVCPCGCAVI